MKKATAFRRWLRLGVLFFLANTLERGAVSLAAYELAIASVPLGPDARIWVLHLRALANSTIPVAISFWWIGCHNDFPFFLRVTPQSGIA
jgi:hypothetical protein